MGGRGIECSIRGMRLSTRLVGGVGVFLDMICGKVCLIGVVEGERWDVG